MLRLSPLKRMNKQHNNLDATHILLIPLCVIAATPIEVLLSVLAYTAITSLIARGKNL